jgi:uncharacterized repeat protein (TIGR03803 family)
MKPLRALESMPWSRMLIMGLGVALLFGAAPARGQTVTYLYTFGTNSGDPANPTSIGVIAQGRDGKLYSTTPTGGADAYGTAFTITTGGALTKLYDFNYSGVGGSPYGGLTLGTDGNFYGTTISGGAGGAGMVFKMTSTGQLTVLHNFTDNPDEGGAVVAPIQGPDGNYYGTSGPVYTGTYGDVYKMTPTGTTTVLHLFDYTDGETPYAITLGTDSNFYGVTHFGGTDNLGTIFKITAGGTLTKLHDFDSTTGSYPIGSLVQGNDGNFYGTTEEGGTANLGGVFKITPAGVFTLLHSFTGGSSDGSLPFAGLALGTDGNFYGTAEFGGTANGGVIFKLSSTGTFSILYSFPGGFGGLGAYPRVTLTQHTNGQFYGDTYGGGYPLNQGTFYSLNVGLGPFVNLVNWSGKVGKTVEILGQGFTGTTKVAFSTTSASFSVVSDTYLTALVPPGAVTGSVTVVAPGGTLRGNRKFLVTPSITSFAPTSGPVGTSVTITGVSFTGANKVTFGGVSAPGFIVNSDTQITATVPTGAKTGKIAVITAGGTATSSGTFLVTPTINSFSPTGGAVGTAVTINGTGLTQTTAVTFGGVAATTFTVNSDSKVTATVPTGAITGKIAITTLGGTATSSDTFTVT